MRLPGHRFEGLWGRVRFRDFYKIHLISPLSQFPFNPIPMKSEKQKKLAKDYADFLVEFEAAKGQGIALGTFLTWVHKNDRSGVTVVMHNGK